MARRVTPPPGPIGEAIANLVADVLHKVTTSTAEPAQEAKQRANMTALGHVHDAVKPLVAPIAQKALDTGAAHPLIEPLLRAMGAK